MIDSEAIASELLAGHDFVSDRVVVSVGGYRIAIRSNARRLLDRLARYFSHFIVDGASDVEVNAIEATPIDLGLEFRDWTREAGKAGRKDSFADLQDGRVVDKVQTGMRFLQSERFRIAHGPTLENVNQVVNFVNSQYMNWLQRGGAKICHASGVVFDEGCLGVAGFSGGGKSTLMLHLMEMSDARYLTNDRLFVRKTLDGSVDAMGIAKLPRVNPGTMLSLPSLRPMLSQERQATLRSLPIDKLWELEEKHDVDVDRIYGSGRILSQAPLKGLLVLNWERASQAPTAVVEVDLETRQDLLGAVMKSPGPFFHAHDGTFHRDDLKPDSYAYTDLLRSIPVWEASGRIDFPEMVDQCQGLMRGELCPKSC